MNQEEFGKILKKIRKDNNLTQQQLANKYNVTYQAVSKWENGKNMPDTVIIKQIASDFNIDLNDLLDGKINRKKKNIIIYIIIFLMLILGIIFLIINSKNKDFEFKTLGSNCKNFNISGSISYNKNKTAIYISNVNYCGGDDKKTYKEIECTLYEKHNDIQKKISSCNNKNNKNIKLEEYLKNITITVDNYSRTCKEYNENDLYLEINAKNENDEIITYKIPLKMSNQCDNK